LLWLATIGHHERGPTCLHHWVVGIVVAVVVIVVGVVAVVHSTIEPGGGAETGSRNATPTVGAKADSDSQATTAIWSS